MKVKISLSGEAGCSTIVKCTKSQLKFLKMIENKMGDNEDEDYSPDMIIGEEEQEA